MPKRTKFAVFALIAIACYGLVLGVEPPVELVWTFEDEDPDFAKDDYNIGMGPGSNVYSATSYLDTSGDWLCMVRRHNNGGGIDWSYMGAGLCRDMAVGWAGDVVVVGRKLGANDDWDNHVFKLSGNGGLIFDRSWGNSFEDSLESVTIGLFGSIYVNGVTYPGPTDTAHSGQIHRLHGITGDVQWTHTEDGQTRTRTHRPVADAYGNVFYRVSRESVATGQLLNSLSGSGSPRWSVPMSHVASTTPSQLYANDSVIIDGIGDLYVGDYDDSTGPLRMRVTAVSNDGGTIWSNSVPIPDGECYFVPQVARNGLGEVYVAGGCQDFGATTGMTVAKFDAAGSLLWTREWLDPQNGLSGIASPLGIAIDDVGQLVLGLRTSEGPATVGLTPAGNIAWEEMIVGTGFGSQREMVVNSSGYPSINSLHAGFERSTLWSFGSQRDWWEADNSWILAHPWIHPGIPPQYHNFFDDLNDWISFHARAGQTYRITATATGTALPGVSVLLFAGDGQTLLGSAAPGGGFAGTGTTELVWTAPTSGSHHVYLRPSDGNSGVDREYEVTVEGDQRPSHVWSKQYGAVGQLDSLADIAEAPDGSHWVVGTHENGSRDAGLHQLSEDGQLLFSRHYGGASTENGRAVVIGPNGNPVIAAMTTSYSSSQDILLMEIDPGSGPTMVRRYDMDVTEDVHDLQPDPYGGYYVLGSNDFFGSEGIWMMRLDPAGEVIWSKTFFAAGGTTAEGFGMTVGDSLVVAGRVGTDGLLMKVSLDGNLQWAKTYDAGGLANAWLSSVVETGDGSLMAVGSHYVTPTKAWVLRTDSIGDPLWSMEYDEGRAHAIVESAEQGFIIAGETSLNDSADGWLLAIDGNGSVLWERAYGGPAHELFTELDLADDGGAIAAGFTISGSPTSLDLLAAKTDRVGLIDGACTAAQPTGAVAAALDLSTSLWASTESEFPPILTYDEPVSHGSALTTTPPATCELHEPGEVAEPLLFSDHDTMSWGTASEDRYSVYRGGSVADTESFACLATNLTVATHDDTEVPALAELWGYLVVADNDLGEGPMGTDSAGNLRRHPADCQP